MGKTAAVPKGDLVQPPREPARARNRRRIVEAATTLWMNDPEASMDDVALRAGMVRRTLYGHFASREVLVIEVATCATAFIDELAWHPEPSDLSAASRLTEMTMHLWTYGNQLRQVWSLTDTTTADGLAEIRKRVTAAITAVVTDGQATGEFVDHLPAPVLSNILAGAATAMRDASATDPLIDARHVALTSLLIVGVDQDRARHCTGMYKRRQA